MNPFTIWICIVQVKIIRQIHHFQKTESSPGLPNPEKESRMIYIGWTDDSTFYLVIRLYIIMFFFIKLPRPDGTFLLVDPNLIDLRVCTSSIFNMFFRNDGDS